MRTLFSKFAFVAAFTLALAFTFSCSGGDDGGSGQGVPFNENSQVYKKDGTAYNGSGVIKILAYSPDDKNEDEIFINSGNLTNGIVKLNLPSTIPDKYLEEFPPLDIHELSSCTDYPDGIKYFGNDNFKLFNSNGERIGRLKLERSDGQEGNGIVYFYFSKSGKIICDYEEEDERYITKMDAKVGWNKIYVHSNYADGYIKEYNTNNILTKEMKWIIKIDD